MHDGDDDDEGYGEDEGDETRGLTPAALLAGARAAHAREQAQAGATTVERVRLGRWLAAIKRSEAYRDEGCASLEAWAQKTLGIGRSMANRYVRIAVLPLKLVRGYDLGISKLDRLVRCPAPVRPGLVAQAVAWQEPVLQAAASAARLSYQKTKDAPRALAAARAAAERAALQKEQGPPRGKQKPSPAAALRQTAELLEAQLDALRKEPGALAREVERLQLVLSRLGYGTAVPDSKKFNDNNKIEEKLPRAAAPADRPAKGGSPSLAPTPPRAAAPAVAPDPPQISTIDLMNALRAGLSPEDEEKFGNALYGLLADHNPEWSALSRRVVREVVGVALRARRFEAEHLREWLRLATAEELEVRWPLVWNSYLCCPDLPDFAKHLADLCYADLPEEFLDEVRAASEAYPPPDDPPEAPEDQAAWKQTVEEDLASFLKTLPAEVW